MNGLVLDSGALSGLAEGDPRAAAIAEVVQRRGGALIVPTVVVAESTTGMGSRDAKVNRVLRHAITDVCDEHTARRAAALRHDARRGSGDTVDAIVVATAELSPGRTVATTDPDDLMALAEHAEGVRVVDYRG